MKAYAAEEFIRSTIQSLVNSLSEYMKMGTVCNFFPYTGIVFVIIKN